MSGKRGVLLVLCALTVFGCRKSPDFLYYRNDPPPQSFETTQKVKEFHGIQDLDIVWVIDNSGSMDAYQQSVIRNMDNFVNIFTKNSALHWKMGLLSTDVLQPPFEGFDPMFPLDYSNPTQAASRFKSAVRMLGISGDSIERSFEPVVNALNAFPTFVRPNSMLALIFVTDAPEQSRMTSFEFMRRLQMIKPDTNRIVFYGVLGPRDWCAPTDDSYGWLGSAYESLLTMVQGKAYPICSPNFGNNLVSLGEDLFQRTSSPKIFLQERPNVDSLEVLYKGQPITGGPKAKGGLWYYDYDLNAVVFYDLNFAPGDQEEITIRYKEDQGR